MGDYLSINWRSRGYLPHFDSDVAQQHIVISLADAVGDDLGPNNSRQRIWAFDQALDRGEGTCLLADPACAAAVQEALLYHDAERYRLLAWCVMPNHVHVVVDAVCDVGDTVRRWKTWSARAINCAANKTGRVWRREYFDRFARDEHHLRTMIHYVENNPVAAGLVAAPEEWQWSSAGCGGLAGQEPGGPSLGLP
ncbi:MAG TPA: transposase [Hyphomonadaceae bacterium]|nr:transposase [Hyphomonadaceae bacterium]